MDDLKEKREARRRKILENSEKRLEKITRVKYDDGTEDTGIGDRHILATSRLVTEHPDSRVASPREEFPVEEVDINERLRNTLEESATASGLNIANSSENAKIWKKLGFKLVVLAVIVRIVHTFKLGYLFGETIVLPFALFMMTQLGSCQFDQNTAGITGPILYFIGISPTRIKNLLICYNVVSSILIYFGIYFFTFICTHLTFAKLLGL